MKGEALPDEKRVEPLHVATALARYRYSFNNETKLHDGIALALEDRLLPYVREHVAGPRDRFDFLVDGGIVIEAKIKGSLAEALAQCLRYAERDDVRGVVLAASRFWANSVVPDTLAGKPFLMVMCESRVF